jgi:translation initiation factor IF-2
MTSSGKVRIYELSKDLGLENKDVLDAAEKLSIAAKSHSSSISDAEAGKIRSLLGKGGNGATPAAAAPAKPAPGKAILSVQKAAPAAPSKPTPAVSKPVAEACCRQAPSGVQTTSGPEASRSGHAQTGDQQAGPCPGESIVSSCAARRASETTCSPGATDGGKAHATACRGQAAGRQQAG